MVCRLFVGRRTNPIPPGRVNDSLRRISISGSGLCALLEVTPRSDPLLKRGTPSEPVPLPDTLNTWWVEGSSHSLWDRSAAGGVLLSKGPASATGAGGPGPSPVQIHLCGSAQRNRGSTAPPVLGPRWPWRVYPRPFSSIPPTVPKRNFSLVVSVLSEI